MLNHRAIEVYGWFEKINMKIIILFAVFCAVHAQNTSSVIYDSFTATIITDGQLKIYEDANLTSTCTNTVKVCDPNEGRRIDGSCNNLKEPSRGTTRSKFYRFLPANYSAGFEPRLSHSGQQLPLCRSLRTNIFSEGRVADSLFSQLSAHYLVFMATDITATRDTSNFVTVKPYCCLPRGATDPVCTPNIVPADDPVFRYSDIRCLNMTRPISFQSSGCVANTTTPERIVTATPLFDLSPVYGDVETPGRRSMQGGKLNVDVINGRDWPQTNGIGLLLGVNFFGIIWFWRLHNHIATELAKVNPCWDDEKLFRTAREINIAFAVQVYYYEMLPLLMGKDNLLKDQVISNNTGYRDIYNETVVPQMAIEYPLVLRWLHVMQDGFLKMYDTQGNYVREFPIVNITGNTEFLTKDNNIDLITQGAFRHPSAKIDDFIVDPDIVGNGLGPSQRATDIMTNDLCKNRYYGVQPYIKYREYCFGGNYTKLDDLSNIIDPERLRIIKEVYKHVDDIDLLAGLWVEKLVAGGYVPPTLYCLTVKQLRRNIISDRHWYERQGRPNAFTPEQLQEIRKSSVSRMMCDIGDSVKEIQPNGFAIPSAGNKIVSCDQIPKIDFGAWNECDPFLQPDTITT